MYRHRRNFRNRSASFNRVLTASTQFLNQMARIASPEEIRRKYQSIIDHYSSERFDAMDDDIFDIMDENEKNLSTMSLMELVQLKEEMTEAMEELSEQWEATAKGAPRVKAKLQKQMDMADGEDLEALEDVYDDIQSFLRAGNPLNQPNDPYRPFLKKIEKEIKERREESSDEQTWRHSTIQLKEDIEEHNEELEAMLDEIRKYPDISKLKVKVEAEVNGLLRGVWSQRKLESKIKEVEGILGRLPSIKKVREAKESFDGDEKERRDFLRRAKEVDDNTWQTSFAHVTAQLKTEAATLVENARLVRVGLHTYNASLASVVSSLEFNIGKMKRAIEEQINNSVENNLRRERDIKFIRQSLNDMNRSIQLSGGVYSKREAEKLAGQFQALEEQAKLAGVESEVARSLAETKVQVQAVVRENSGLMGKFRGLFRRASYEHMADMNYMGGDLEAEYMADLEMMSDMGYMGEDLEADELEMDHMATRRASLRVRKPMSSRIASRYLR